MDDLISRQAAIEIRFSHGIHENGLLYVPYWEVKERISNLPSVQPERWIPVTEKFPENERRVLCTVQSGKHFCVIPCIFIQKTKRWLPEMHGNHDNVIAWRELSAPYRLKHES